MKELVDFVMHKSLSSQRDRNAHRVRLRLMSLSLIASNLRRSSQEDRVVSQKESHLVTAILTRRQPSVEVCGEMMSPDGSERVGSFNSELYFRLEICGGSYCERHFLVGLTGAG